MRGCQAPLQWFPGLGSSFGDGLESSRLERLRTQAAQAEIPICKLEETLHSHVWGT